MADMKGEDLGRMCVCVCAHACVHVSVYACTCVKTVRRKKNCKWIFSPTQFVRTNNHANPPPPPPNSPMLKESVVCVYVCTCKCACLPVK